MNRIGGGGVRRRTDRLVRRPELRIIPGMTTTPLSELRRASRRKPTLQALAKKLGCTNALISKFENGIQPLSHRLLVLYAREVGCTVQRVQDAFAVARAAYYNAQAAQANRDLEERLGVKALPPRKASVGQ